MFSFFKPTCPVEPDAKEWIESRFTWLTEEFGVGKLKNASTILPTEEFLPSQYECTEEGLEDLMIRVAGYMDVDANQLRLNYYQDDNPQFMGATTERTAGLYVENEGYFDIWLEVDQLDDPVAVVATLAHEIGHVVLLGQNRISPETEDHEQLTDLLTVFLGMGIFPANSALHESNWSDGNWSGWTVGKRGYLSMHMYGYALALYALARGEQNPTWAMYLRPDTKAYLQRAIRYITKTSDCTFTHACYAG